MGGIRLISIQGPRAGEVARQEIGRSGDWLRKLERAGVIPAAPRDFNGYRVYPPEFVGASTVGRLPRHGRQKGRRGIEVWTLPDHRLQPPPRPSKRI